MLSRTNAVPERKATAFEPVVEGRYSENRSSPCRVQATTLRSAQRLHLDLIVK